MMKKENKSTCRPVHYGNIFSCILVRQKDKALFDHLVAFS